MSKSTKLVKAINSIITFQRKFPQGIQSVTIKGKEALADLSLDRNNDMDLHLNADKDKVNNVSSSLPYLQATTSTSGSDPDKQKTVTLTQDLREFPLVNGELVTVEKTENTLTINDSKVKELVESKAEALKKELKGGTGAPASTLTLNGGELVKIDKAGDTLTLNDSKVKELVSTKTKEVKDEVVAMLPHVFTLNKIADINNASLELQTRADDSIAYISIIYYKDSTSNIITLSMPTGAGEFIRIEDGVYTNFNISRDDTSLEIHFKEPINDLTIKGVIFGDLLEAPSLSINSLDGTYDSHTTTGNVSQPL